MSTKRRTLSDFLLTKIMWMIVYSVLLVCLLLFFENAKKTTCVKTLNPGGPRIGTTMTPIVLCGPAVKWMRWWCNLWRNPGLSIQLHWPILHCGRSTHASFSLYSVSFPRFYTASAGYQFGSSVLIPRTLIYLSDIIVVIQHTLTVHSSVIDIGRCFSTYFTCRCDIV